MSQIWIPYYSPHNQENKHNEFGYSDHQIGGQVYNIIEAKIGNKDMFISPKTFELWESDNTIKENYLKTISDQGHIIKYILRIEFTPKDNESGNVKLTLEPINGGTPFKTYTKFLKEESDPDVTTKEKDGWTNQVIRDLERISDSKDPLEKMTITKFECSDEEYATIYPREIQNTLWTDKEINYMYFYDHNPSAKIKRISITGKNGMHGCVDCEPEAWIQIFYKQNQISDTLKINFPAYSSIPSIVSKIKENLKQ